MKKEELGIYIHIPFCMKKCYYCDFISYQDQTNYVETYIKKVIEEMNQYDFSKYNVTTIYIGGGTPSYIDEKYIKELLQNIKTKLTKMKKVYKEEGEIEEIDQTEKIENETKLEDMEITIEINPGTITKNKLQTYKSSGINRISIGLQSTNDKLLKQIGRIHNYEQFLETYQLARQLGFKNINIDLMIGLPNQTIQDIKHDLKEIQILNPNHISVYSLIVEENTRIEKLISDGELQLPAEEIERQMYWYVKNKLEEIGYKHYEISNFAKPGKESKHNLNCWEQQQYIGLGASAHSYLNGIRYSNSAFFKNSKGDFLEWDFKNKQIEENQNLEDRKREYMLLGLRKIDGVSIKKFKEKYIDNPIFLYRKELEKLVSQHLLIIDGNNIRLTNKGIDFANLVWQEFV